MRIHYKLIVRGNEVSVKKLFVSVPMKGRTEEEIKASMNKRHRDAEKIIGEELELIQSYNTDNAPPNVNEAVWHLGKAIQMLAEADYISVPQYRYGYRGCQIEYDIAKAYGIDIVPISQADIWIKE